MRNRTRNQRGSFQTDISTGESVTYTCLMEQTDSVASSLRSKGLQTGDVVLIMAANHVQVAVFFFAVWKAGACNACLILNLLTGDAVFLSCRWSRNEHVALSDDIRARAEEVGAKFILTDQQRAARVLDAVRDVDSIREIFVIGNQERGTSFDELLQQPAQGVPN
jgi:acyl-CoA synthetase (AMP-forming)/AMP-acid ligase II